MIPLGIAAKLAWWLAETKTGRAVAAVGAISVAAGVALLKALNAGKSAERARENKASLENLRSRARTDDEVKSLGAGDTDERLSRWVRDDDAR